MHSPFDTTSAREAARLLAAANDALTAYREYVTDCGDHYRSAVGDLIALDTLGDFAADANLIGTPEDAFARILIEQKDVYGRDGNDFFDGSRDRIRDAAEALGLTGDEDDRAPEPAEAALPLLRERAEDDATLTLPEAHWAIVEWMDGGETVVGPFTLDAAQEWADGYPDGDDDLSDIRIYETHDLRWRYRDYPTMVINAPVVDADGSPYGTFDSSWYIVGGAA